MFILSACENWSILATILFIKNLVRIASYIIPAIIILMVSIDLSKAVIANDDEAIKRSQKLAIKRIIAGLVIFFIPMVVEVSFNMLGDTGSSWTKCYSNATTSKVNSLKAEQDKKDEKKRAEQNKTLEQIKADYKKKQEEEKQKRAAYRAKDKEKNSGGSGSAPSSICTNCSNSEKIAQTAELLAYPNGTPKSTWTHNYPKHKKFTSWSQLTKTKPTQAFMTAYDKVKPNHWTNGCSKTYGCWPAIGASCDRFVFVTVKYSGYDSGIPTGLASQISYLPKSSKWKKVSSAGRGDICIKSSHVKIFLGNGKQAEAGYKTKKFGRIISGNCSGYKVYRAK